MATPFVLLSPVPDPQMVTVPQPLEIFQRKKMLNNLSNSDTKIKLWKQPFRLDHHSRRKWVFRITSWRFQIFLFSPLPGEMIEFDESFWNGLKPATRYCNLSGSTFSHRNVAQLSSGFFQEEIHRVSKISPKLQKLLVGGTILNNLDRLVDVLEGVKAHQNPQATKTIGIDGSCGFDQSLEDERSPVVSDVFFTAFRIGWCVDLQQKDLPCFLWVCEKWQESIIQPNQ